MYIVTIMSMMLTLSMILINSCGLLEQQQLEQQAISSEQELVALVSTDTNDYQKLVVSNGQVAGSFVLIPPGTLKVDSSQDDLIIIVERGDDNSNQAIMSDLGLEEDNAVTNQGATVIIRPNQALTVQGQLVVAMPAPSSINSALWLQQNSDKLAVLYLIYDQVNKELRSGLIPATQIDLFIDNEVRELISVSISSFGSFQAVMLANAVSNRIETKSSKKFIVNAKKESVLAIATGYQQISPSEKEKLVAATKDFNPQISDKLKKKIEVIKINNPKDKPKDSNQPQEQEADEPLSQEEQIEPHVTLSCALDVIKEQGDSVECFLHLSQKISLPVTVGLNYLGSASFSEYSGGKITHTIEANTLLTQWTLTSIDDEIYEGDENIIITIDTVSNGVENSPQQVTLLLQDNETIPTVGLTCEQSEVTENEGSTFCNLFLSHQTILPVSIDIDYSGSSSSTDYSGKNITHTIAANSLSSSWEIKAIDNGVYEANKTIIIDISSVSNASEVGVQQHIINIIENESCTIRPDWFDEVESTYSCPGSHDSCSGATWSGNLHITCSGGERKCKNTTFNCGAGNCSVTASSGAHDLYKNSVVYALDVAQGNGFILNCNASGQRDCIGTHVWCPTTAGSTCDCNGSCSGVTMHCPLGGATCRINSTEISEAQKESIASNVYCL